MSPPVTLVWKSRKLSPPGMSFAALGEDALHGLGRGSLPHRCGDLGQPVVGLGFDAERLDDRCRGLLGTDER